MYMVFRLTTVTFCALVVFLAPLAASATWFNDSYQYCRKLTMTAGGTSGGVATTTTAGFALVATSTMSTLAATSSAGRIYEVSSATGTTTPVDVAVTNGTDCNSDGGSLIDFYFEKYVQTTGEFVLWVEPTDISSTTAKTVLLYYGYSDNSATDQSDEAGVFGSLGEAIVYNLREDPGSAGAGGILDSTANNNDGTDQGAMDINDQVQGWLNGAFHFDGANDYIETPWTLDGDNNFTLSAWIYADAFGGGYQNIMAARTCFCWAFFERGAGVIGFSFDNQWGSDATSVNYTISAGVWYQALVTYDTVSNTLKLFVDSILRDELVLASSSSGPLAVASFDGNYEWDGILDDVRVFERTLDPMDVLTIYNNTADSATFWTFGAEETKSVASNSRVIRLLGVRLYGVRLF